MWLVAIDDFIFEDWDIEPGLITDKSSHLTFGSDRRAGVYSSIFFNSSAGAATWFVVIKCPSVTARDALLSVLAAPSRWELRLQALRERSTDDYVTTNASVSSVESVGSTDLNVTFESNDSIWHADAYQTVTKSFTDPMDLVVHLPAPGNIPTNPIIRITPTALQEWSSSSVGWRYRQRWMITNNSDEPLFRYPAHIDLASTTTLVSSGKALASGYDVRLWLDGIEQDRALIRWNAADTKLWFIIPALPAGGSLVYDVVYGNLFAEPTYRNIGSLSSITTAQNYWSANDVAQADNTAVSSVPFTYGGVALIQGTGANQPTLQLNELPSGRAALQFDGGSDFLTATSLAYPSSHGYCYTFVFKVTNLGINRALGGSSAAGGVAIVLDTTGVIKIVKASTSTIAQSTQTVTINTWNIVQAYTTATDAWISVNGVEEHFTHSTTLTGGTSLRIGQYNNVDYFAGLISFVHIMQNPTVDQRRLIEGRLAQLGGLAETNLPVTSDYTTIGLSYPDAPAFDLNISHNARWFYKTNDTLVNAGKGLWYLSSTLDGGVADYSVPGAWRPELTFENPNNDDQVLQSRSFQQVVGTDTWYQAILNAARWKGVGFASIDPYVGNDPFDGIVLHNPFGIRYVEIFGWEWSNYAFRMTVVTTTAGADTTSDEVQISASPVTRVVAISRDSGGDNWHIIQQYNTSTGGTATVGGTTRWTPPTPAKFFGIACWPYLRVEIPDDYEAGVRIRSLEDIDVTVDSVGKLVTTQIQSEVEIFELAMELRLGGGINAVGPYSTLLIGNARGLDGAGTPRAAIKLGTEALEIDTSEHTHSVWTTNFSHKIEDISAHAVRGLESYIHDGTTGEYRSHQWLPVSPPRRFVPNADFGANLSSWIIEGATAGFAYTVTHDATVGEHQLGSLKINITASPTIGAIYVLNQKLFAVSGQESIEIGASMRSTNPDVQPKLVVYWYTDAESTYLSAEDGPEWADWIGDPAALAWYRRTLGLVAPIGARYFRIGVVLSIPVATSTGSIWFDDITLNDNDLMVYDAGGGSFDVTAIVPEQWIP